MVTIRGHPIDVDYRAELEGFRWVRATWTDTKLIAASPFRYERTPSFAVMLDHGGWRDYGAIDPEYETGGFVKLLSFLRDETVGETCDYLAAKYGGIESDKPDEVAYSPLNLTVEKRGIVRLNRTTLEEYRFRSPYLGRRDISEGVQRLMRIGYDKQRRAVTIPWFNADGSLGNVKYRRTDSKTFWYIRGGRPIREMVYGINVAYEQRLKRAAIVEAEIDAMTLMSAGIFAIATGGTAFNAAKRDAILRSPIEELTLWRDNDAAGRTWRNRILAELRGRVELRLSTVPSTYKDVNEWAVSCGCDALCRSKSEFIG